MKKNKVYTDEHAAAGVATELPVIECWPNQYNEEYEIEVTNPEFTSVCPKTGLPDHGALTLRYTPGEHCLELKSLKMYWLAYRNLGIFQENIVNKFLRDVVKYADPIRATVIGDFTPRGGIGTVIRASYERASRKDGSRLQTSAEHSPGPSRDPVRFASIPQKRKGPSRLRTNAEHPPDPSRDRLRFARVLQKRKGQSRLRPNAARSPGPTRDPVRFARIPQKTGAKRGR